MGRVVAQIKKTRRDFADAWHGFWFSEADPTTLCVMRILVGGMLVYTVGVWGLKFDAFLGEHAWNSPALLQELQTPGIAPSFWWYVPDGWQTSVHWLCMSVLVMFTIGLWTRATSVLSMLIIVSYSYRAHMSNYGLDQINAILTFYLCLAPCGARFSVDNWMRQYRIRNALAVKIPTPKSVSANLATRLMQVHFCIIYSFAALAKLQGEGWWNGEAIWMALANTEYQTVDMTWIAWYPWISDIVTHGSMLFELTFWVLVWGRCRPVVLFAGAMLHLSIGAFMGMWTFAFIMIFGHLAFWPPSLVDRIIERVVNPTRRRKKTPPRQPRVIDEICTTVRTEPAAAASASATQLVCVDCNQTTRVRCINHFTEHGFECYATDNPEAAVRLCETLQPQAIIIVGRSLTDSGLRDFHERLTLRAANTLALYILGAQQIERLAESLESKTCHLVDSSRSVRDVRRFVESSLQRPGGGVAVATDVLPNSHNFETTEDQGSCNNAAPKKPR